jgi:5,10-methenyltetrahydrofolate synthetase
VIVSSMRPSSPVPDRAALRQRLLRQREQFAAGAQAPEANAALARHLHAVLLRLEPQCLGVYWPIRCEFNPRDAFGDDNGLSRLDPGPALALPHCRRAPQAMEYRRWDGATPILADELGLPTGGGAAVVPDVVVVPCVGYTCEGLRLGYGGGYFDRWLAAHPEATAVGVSWSFGELDDTQFVAEPHDRPLMLVVTERGVVA